jgi:hypothetical protein
VLALSAKVTRLAVAVIACRVTQAVAGTVVPRAKRLLGAICSLPAFIANAAPFMKTAFAMPVARHLAVRNVACCALPPDGALAA